MRQELRWRCSTENTQLVDIHSSSTSCISTSGLSSSSSFHHIYLPHHLHLLCTLLSFNHKESSWIRKSIRNHLYKMADGRGKEFSWCCCQCYLNPVISRETMMMHGSCATLILIIFKVQYNAVSNNVAPISVKHPYWTVLVYTTYIILLVLIHLHNTCTSLEATSLLWLLPETWS